MSLKTGDKVKVKLPGGEIEGEVTIQIIPGSDGKDKLGVECKDAEGNPFYVEVPASWCTPVVPPEEVYFLPIYKGGRIIPQTSGLPPKSLNEAIFSAAASYEVETFLEVVVRARHGKPRLQDEDPTFNAKDMGQWIAPSAATTGVPKVVRPEGLGK